MINPDKLRAARAYLGITQPQLSEKSGVSVHPINLIEMGRKSNIHQKTENLIMQALSNAGIVFTEHGIERRENTQTILVDYLDVLDDVEKTLAGSGEVCFHRADDRRSTDAVKARMEDLRDKGIKMRSTIESGNTYMQFAPEHYRWIPSDYFADGEVAVTYADKYVLHVREVAESGVHTHQYFLFKSSSLCKAHQADFEYWWRNGECPSL